MNYNELISSGLLESYVLGTASDQEILLINKLSKEHPEVLQEIQRIEENLVSFSSSLHAPLNPDLKQKINAKLFNVEENLKSDSAEIKELPVQHNKIRLYQFGMAASLLLFVTSLFYIIMFQQKFERVNNELAELSETKSNMANVLTMQEASLSIMDSELQIMRDPNIKKIPLKGMNSLYASSAIVHFNTKTNEIYFNASSLTAPSDKQYQLWAIVGGKPVSAGVIDLNDTNIFQKMNAIKDAQAFAVTIENVGGAINPSLETMCLLGQV